MRRYAIGIVIASSLLFLCSFVAPGHAQVTAGDTDITGDGTPDGWTNILYINEANPFDFTTTGQTQGMLTTVNFWVADAREKQGVITPFVAEPLVPDPVSGADYVIRAIGTTRDNTNWKCGGQYQFPFHDNTKFAVQNGWVVGFLTSDPEGNRVDAMSPVPFQYSDVAGWLTGTSSPGTGLPAIELNQPITEGASGTNTDAYGLRDYQFSVQAQPGTVQPQVPAGGRVGGACPVEEPHTGNIAGTHPIRSTGGPDGWTNVLYINEAEPFNFTEFGRSEGKLTEFKFWAATDAAGMVTPFVAEPLVANPQTGDDFIIRAIGTTREAGTDWTSTGLQTFKFNESDSFTVKNGWLAGFVSSDAKGESDLARSPIPFVGSDVEGWLTGTSTAASGAPRIGLGETITEGVSGTFTDAAGKRRYQFQIRAEGGNVGVPGDYNANGTLEAADIDALTSAIRNGQSDAKYDLDHNGKVNGDDRVVWVSTLRKTYVGDANLDGEFSSADLVMVFQRGKYEDNVEDNTTWEEGDWDGDLDFDSSDFVYSFQGGGYEAGPLTAVATVPEPSTPVMLITSIAMACLVLRRMNRVVGFDCV